MKIKIRLTRVQESALDCAGIFEDPDGLGEEILRDAIEGLTLTIEDCDEMRDAADAVSELSDLEGDRAESPGRDAEQRESDRRASRALQKLASKLRKASYRLAGEVL